MHSFFMGYGLHVPFKSHYIYKKSEFMIYLNEKSINVPNLLGKTPKTMKLENRLTHKQYYFEVENVTFSSSRYEFVIDFSALEDGQYFYRVLDADSLLLASGVAQKGSFDATVKEYNHEKTYVQYE